MANRIGIVSTRLSGTDGVSLVVPNVMDFDSPAPEIDGYADDLRKALDVDRGNYLLLQPTRVVPRKRIELAISLLKQLEMPATLLISHASGDEGKEYNNYLYELVELFDVDVRFAGDHFAFERSAGEGGNKIYGLGDAYLASDIVTYPSTIEGFGNAFLEAIYYRRPIVMSTYEIYRIDIRPKGFNVVEFEDYVSDETVKKTRELLLDPQMSAEMFDTNYRIARKHYSFTNLEKYLQVLINISVGDF